MTCNHLHCNLPQSRQRLQDMQMTSVTQTETVKARQVARKPAPLPTYEALPSAALRKRWLGVEQHLASSKHPDPPGLCCLLFGSDTCCWGRVTTGVAPALQPASLSVATMIQRPQKHKNFGQ